MARHDDYAIVNVENVYYDLVQSGEFVAGTVAAVMGTADARMAWIKAFKSNTGTIYVGGAGVTAQDGTADTTTGFSLGAGDVLGPVPVSNMSVLSAVGSAAGQGGSWMTVS